MRPSHVAVVLMSLLWVRLVVADGLIVIDRPIALPGVRVPTVTPLHVERHHVTVTIKDQVATTHVDQVFYNPSGQRLEGTYLFPLPDGGVIDQFSMDIEGKMVEAELLDADKARKIYEDIVRRAQDPALLEYVGRGALKARIFPIEPNSRKQVKLSYSQLLKSDAGTVSYLYPLNTEKFSSAPLQSVSIKVEVHCSDPIKSIYSPSHPVEVTRHGDKRAVVGYEAKNVKPDTDFHLYFAPQADGKPIGVTLLTFNDGKEDPTGSKDGYFLLLASPGAVEDERRIVPKDIVFVLDTSGSMAEGGKLDQAKKALRFCLENLNADDRFEIIRFSTEAEPLFGKLAPFDHEGRDAARQFIDQFRPIGGTAIHEALHLAVKTMPHDPARPAFIVFLTDGRPTIGETREDAIIADIAKTNFRGRVFCFGVGTDLNTHLLDKLTEKMRGYSTYVLPEEDIEVKLSGFYTRIASPVLADVKLDFGAAVRVSRMYPQSHELPDLFKGDQLVAVGRYSGDGHASITLEGQVITPGGGNRRSFVHEGVFTRDNTEHGFIPRLWATRRVGYLLDEIRLHGEKAELKDEVAKLARHYGIVTPYTSYLILEDEARRNVPMARRSLQEMAGDALVVAEAGARFRGMADDRGGRDAVSGATSNTMLKQSERSDGYLTANAAAAPTTGQAKLVAQGESQTRVVNGRAFYQNGVEWIDANVQARTDARVVEIEFNSEEYFALARRNRDVANWLSVGPNVQVMVDGVVYQIRQRS
jgi:Ca-activated chloride channel family protein